MITNYKFQVELWNGKEVVGYTSLKVPFDAQNVVFCFAPSPLKQIYGKTYESISLPVVYRVVGDNGVDYTVRRCLDIRRKSKRQIDLLKNYDGGWL